MSERRGCSVYQVARHMNDQKPCYGCPDGFGGQKWYLPLQNRVRAMAALTVLETRSKMPSRRPDHYPRGQVAASSALQRGPSAWARPSRTGFAVFDHGACCSRRLGDNGGTSLALQMSVVSILSNVALELVAKAVGPLQDGDLTGDPEGVPQARGALFRDRAVTA